MTSADQTKKAMRDLFYPQRPDGSYCLDRTEWLEMGYQSYLEKHDIYISLQVHDELLYDIPEDTPMEVLEGIASFMCNAIPNNKGVEFKSDIEVSKYWGGKFSEEELQMYLNGELDWVEVFEKEVETKLAKFGMEYTIGAFAEVSENEAPIMMSLKKEDVHFKVGLGEDDDDDEEDAA